MKQVSYLCFGFLPPLSAAEKARIALWREQEETFQAEALDKKTQLFPLERPKSE